MGAALRMTIPTQRVLRVLLEAPDREHYGLEIGDRADLRSGTVHPILARLEGVGWLESRWEDVDPSAEGRPARRYYRLTAEGALAAQAALAAVARTAPARRLRPLAGDA
jgi:DNA-binding PadR family transcriptional regulator